MRAETLDDYKRKDLLLDGIRNSTMKQVCYVVLTVRFPPEFLSRPPSGATLPPGEGIGSVPAVFSSSVPGRTAFGVPHSDGIGGRGRNMVKLLLVLISLDLEGNRLRR